MLGPLYFVATPAIPTPPPVVLLLPLLKLELDGRAENSEFWMEFKAALPPALFDELLPLLLPLLNEPPLLKLLPPLLNELPPLLNELPPLLNELPPLLKELPPLLPLLKELCWPLFD